MLGPIRSLVTAGRLYLMRRRQFDNLGLRRYFRRFGIEVGLYSYGCFDRWRMPGPMRVGRYCSIASTARSILRNHPMAALTTHPALYEAQFGVVEADTLETGEPLVLEDDVWIGHNALILPGCKRIGRGAVIGAGAVVTKDVDAYAVMAGNPARKLRDRFPPDLAAAIEASRWWEMDLSELKRLVKSRPDLVFAPSVAAVAGWSGRP